MKLTEDQILNYRSDGIPDEILACMSNVMALARKLDSKDPECDEAKLRQLLHKTILHAKARTEHYYNKRQLQFGIHNLRLKRLLNSFPSLLQSFGFPAE